MANYVGQEGIDLWVAPEGGDNLIRGSFISFIPLEDMKSIQAIPGVAAADPILEAFLPVQSLNLSDPQKHLTLITIGYRLPNGLGGAPAYFKGRAPKRFNEVALDRAAAYRLDVGIGDTIKVRGYKGIITGLTTGTNILATQFVFVNIDAMAYASNSTGLASVVLIKLAPNADRDRLVQTIEIQFPHLRAYTREYFLASNEREVSAGFLPVLTLITVLGVGAAVLLVGLLILSVVDERRGDIAVLLALGTGSAAVSRGLLAHTAVVSLTGALIGIASSYALQKLLDIALPTISLEIAAVDVIAIAALFLVSGLGAAVAPVIQLSAIDPLDAFRS
jgi:ABC-type lipoprotein release transport system permease subunit